jgi:hypothetical protein
MKQTTETKWDSIEFLHGYKVYGKVTRTEIIVRVEKDGDTTKYAEWGMPKILGLKAAMDQAAIQTTDDQIRE